MFERETKREKILEARQREIRLKERSRSQQSREDQPGPDQSQDTSHQLIARAQREFFLAVEAELQKTDKVSSVLWSQSKQPSPGDKDDSSAPSAFISRKRSTIPDPNPDPTLTLT